MSKCTKGKLSLNNYHYPHAYLVIRKGSDDNDAFPRPRKICDVTLDGKTEEEYEANAIELVRRWNAFEKGGIVNDLLEVFKPVKNILEDIHFRHSNKKSFHNNRIAADSSTGIEIIKAAIDKCKA